MDSTEETESKRPEGVGTGSNRPPLSARAAWRVLAKISWDWWALFVLTGGFALLVTYVSYLRGQNFYTAAWDLGINQQLLWTTAHGQLMYETADLSFFNAHSYLQVHSTYIAFLVAPIYSAAATPLTLFVLQSVVFALSAIPLYLFAVEVLRRPALRLAVVALYFSCFAIISGLSYDFHWESFLPLEFLTFFLLVRRERYALSLLPLAIGTSTLEVFPFLAGGALVFALYERGAALGWATHSFVRDRRVRVLAGLLVVALGAYIAVRALQYDVIPWLLQVPSTTGGSPGGIGSTVGWGANSATLYSSSAYWLLLLAALAFLPLLAPRFLILTVPWFVYSVFIAPWFSHDFGNHYALIAMVTLTLAAIAGLATLERSETLDRVSTLLLASLVGLIAALAIIASIGANSVRLLQYNAGPVFWVPLLLLFGIAVALSVRIRRERRGRVTDTPRHLAPAASRPRLRPRAILSLLATAFVAVLVLDAVLSPMNPVNFGATPSPGYWFSWGENPMVHAMGWLTAMLPPGAVVLASDHLFPYVANDPNAWAIPWFVINATTNPVPYFPFTETHLPPYVLADSAEMQVMPTFLATDLFNSSVYGLVAYAYMAAYPGTVYLFALGHSGPPKVKVVVPSASHLYFDWSNLTLGPAGSVRESPQSTYGRAIASDAIGPLKGTATNVWAGPYVPLLPGTYAVTFSVLGSAAPLTNNSTSFAYLDIVWNGGTVQHTLLNYSITGARLNPNGWTQLIYTLNLTEPYPQVEFRGFLMLFDGFSAGSMTLNYVEVQRVAA